MSKLLTIPVADSFETSLAQIRNGGTGTMYLNAVPNVTIPSGYKTILVVDPGTSSQQAVYIDSINTGAKTVNVSSVAVDKILGTAYTTTTHAIGAIVRISDNYQFWEDIQTAINDNADDIESNTTAISTINTTLNSNIAYIQNGTYTTTTSTDGSDTYTCSLSPAITSYVSGLTTTVFFSTTNTGACTINVNGLGAKNIKTIDGNDPQSGSIRTGKPITLKYDGTQFILQHEDIASSTSKGIVELATDAEVITGTSTTLVPTVAQVVSRTRYSSPGTGYEVTQTSTGSTTTPSIYLVKGGVLSAYGYVANSSGSTAFSISRIQISDDGSSWSTYYDLFNNNFTSSSVFTPDRNFATSFIVPEGKYVRGYVECVGSMTAYIRLIGQSNI